MSARKRTIGERMRRGLGRPALSVMAALAFLHVACGDERITDPEAVASRGGPQEPGQVTDLVATEVTRTSVTLSWTEVHDGRGQPADYQVRYAYAQLDPEWGEATMVEDGECADPVEGSEVGATIACTVTALEPDTDYDFRLVSFRERGKWRVYGKLSNIAAARTAGSAPDPATDPEQVTDLFVAGATESSVMLTWTEVDDGTGGPADYTVRYLPAPFGDRWGEATIITAGECGSPVAGTEVGNGITCTVNSLEEDTSYDFRLVSYRWEEDGSKIFGELSNVATGETASSESSDESAGLYPNEPPGLTKLTERDFELLEEDGWVHTQRSDSEATIETVTSPPISPPTVGQVFYESTYTGGSSPDFWTRHISSFEATEIYWAVWMRLSPNFEPHPFSRVNKVGFVWDQNATGEDKPVVAWNLEHRDGGMFPNIRIQDNPDSGWLDQNVGERRYITPGEWFKWEVYLRHDAGGSPSVIRWWVNGELKGDYVDLISFQGDHWGHTGQFTIRPIWGGIGGNPPGEGMWMQFDRVYISLKK